MHHHMGWVPSVILCVLMYTISRSDQTLARLKFESLINEHFPRLFHPKIAM